MSIVSEAEYLAWVWERWTTLFDEIRSMHEQETEASGQVDIIKSAKGPTTAPASQP